MADPTSNEERNKVRCPVCGIPWPEHPADTICARHRPIQVPAWVAAAAKAIEATTGRRVKADATR